MLNLLDRFALAHTQVTRFSADLKEIVGPDQKFSAKVELKLTPRDMPKDGGVAQYQVTARLLCRGHREGTESIEPLFKVEIIVQAVYRQFCGEAVDFETFTACHGSLTRQLYPLIHHQLRPILKQFELDQVKLPYDLPGQASETVSQRQVH